MKILVVDDDVIVIKSCTRILESENFEVIAVPGADEALEVLREKSFDLLLIDVKMPKHDGIFLVNAIRKDLSTIPIIVMSGYPTPETIAGAYNAGANQLIPKPFRLDELIKMIRLVMQKTLNKRPSDAA
jgi:DNA-binding response OmpR family regulator